MIRRGAVVCLAALFACSRGETQAPPAAKPTVVQPPQRFADRSRRGSLAAAPLADAAAIIDAQYRVTPDRRFLLALSDVSELVSGAGVMPEINFTKDAWTVTASGRAIGTLPELPTFADGLALVTGFARDLRREHPAKPARAANAVEQQRLSAFYAPSLFEAAKSLESPADLAHAAVLLDVQTIDRMGVADPVHARTLALLAIASAGGTAAAEDVALLASAFGYEDEARELAAKLPPGVKSGDARSVYFAARDALAAAPSGKRHDVLMAQAAQLPARGTPVLMDPLLLDDAMMTARAALEATSADVAGESSGTAGSMLGSPRRVDDATLLSHFEQGLPARVRALQSRVFPAAVVQAHYEALLHSAMAKMFETHVEDYGDREGATEFARRLGKPPSPLAGQVAEWMALTAATRYGETQVVPEAALARLPLLGAIPRAKLILAYLDSGRVSLASINAATWALFPQLDSRPDALLAAGQLSNRVLADPMRRERYMGTALARARSAGSWGMRGNYYALIGDRTRLREIVESPLAEPADRAVALHALAKLPGADAATIARRFEALIAEVGYDGAYSSFADFINGRADWKTKERVIRRWFDEKREAAPTTTAYYAASLGHALEQQGRYDEAWKAIQPHFHVGSATIMEEEMSVRERRGDVEGALDLGRRMVERYPDVGSRVALASVLWRRRRFDEAAALFAPDNRYRTAGTTEELKRALLETFSPKQKDDAVAAFRAIVRARSDPHTLAYTADAVRTAGHPELAFGLASTLIETYTLAARAPEAGAAHVSAWQALRDWKGEEAANAWLRPRVPDEAVLQLTIIAYQSGEPNLVLAWASPRPDPAKSIEVQSLLALAMTQARVPAGDPRRLALLDQVRAEGDQPKTLLPVAQYLLGIMEEPAFLRWPDHAGGRSLASWCVAVKAAAEGDCERALPWLLAASQGPEGDHAAIWAIGALRELAKSRRSWSDIRKYGCLRTSGAQ